MPDFCPNWYQEHLYEDSFLGLSVLQPKNIIGCYEVVNGPLDQATLIIEMCMYGVLIFVGCVGFRSCNRKSLDFYRLFTFYTFATIAVPLAIRISPYRQHSGFNRMLGFGILIHNMAEFFIIINCWWGSFRATALSLILYVWAFTCFQTFLSLQWLFFIGMFQGAFLDFVVVGTFYYIYKFVANPELKSKYIKKTNRKCYACLGFGAAMLHIISILPLFLGFSTLLPFGAITIIFLGPTFILYMWFASTDKTSQPNLLKPIGPSGGLYDLYLYKPLKNTKDIEKNLKQQHDNINDDEKNEDENENENESFLARKRQQSVDGTYKEFNFIVLLEKGLLSIFPQSKKYLTKVLITAFIVNVICSVIIFIAPCYVDSSDTLCDKTIPPSA